MRQGGVCLSVTNSGGTNGAEDRNQGEDRKEPVCQYPKGDEGDDS